MAEYNERSTLHLKLVLFFITKKQLKHINTQFGVSVYVPMYLSIMRDAEYISIGSLWKTWKN